VKFTVVIPVYNGERTIVKAVCSALAQTVASFEVVVVDDGSTDGTSDAVRAIDDERLRLHTKTNMGRSNARNTGLTMATGEFVLFLDADDELHPQALANALELLMADETIDVVQGATRYLRNDEFVVEVPPGLRHASPSAIYAKNLIPISSAVIRRKNCSKFPEALEHCEDWVFWIESLSFAKTATHPEVTSIVHLGENNTSRDVRRMSAHELIPLLKYRKKRLAPRWEIYRVIRIIGDVARYSSLERVAPIEDLLAKSSVWAAVDRAMRKWPKTAISVERCLGSFLPEVPA